MVNLPSYDFVPILGWWVLSKNILDQNFRPKSSCFWGEHFKWKMNIEIFLANTNWSIWITFCYVANPIWEACQKISIPLSRWSLLQNDLSQLYFYIFSTMIIYAIFWQMWSNFFLFHDAIFRMCCLLSILLKYMPFLAYVIFWHLAHAKLSDNWKMSERTAVFHSWESCLQWKLIVDFSIFGTKLNPKK